MSRIQLPKDALQRVRIGKAFAEYDIIRTDPELFVSTPATLAALQPDNQNCFFVGRRGAGKTAITYQVQRKFPRTIQITPQIFDLLKLPLENDEFKDTRQRPFKSLMYSMERALLDEVIKVWVETGIFSFDKAPDAIRRERGLIEDCDFDQRVLNLTEEIFEAYTTDNEKLWLRQVKRSKELVSESSEVSVNGSFDFILLIDRLDESWDGSDSAIICLMALMHATVRLTASTNFIRPYVFIRENIYDRIRALDNEFSRLETSVVFLDWTPQKLTELIERRLVKPFNTKPKLGGESWSYFFEDNKEKTSISSVMSLCQHRPRDVLMLTSYAIDSAVSHGNTKITESDLERASKRYSTSRLKDLGDEFSENFPNIILILEYFFGLGNEYTSIAIEDFIQKLLVNETISKHCKQWFYGYTAPFRFVELLYNIGFLGIKRGSTIEYKDSSKDSNSKPAFDKNTIFVIHPTYREALNLRPILLKDLKEDTMLKSEGMLEDLPDSFQLDEYKSALEDTLQQLKELPKGSSGQKEFEEIIGQAVKLCFFRSLTNIEPNNQTIEHYSMQNWIAKNIATEGFWEEIRSKHEATQVVWSCRNHDDLYEDDFKQIGNYFNKEFGYFGILVFRGEEIKHQYIRYISKEASKSRIGLISILNQKDIEVFLRQAIKGTYKESHIKDKYDAILDRVI